VAADHRGSGRDEKARNPIGRSHGVRGGQVDGPQAAPLGPQLDGPHDAAHAASDSESTPMIAGGTYTAIFNSRRRD